ncbi:LAME_0E13036g1_1 [Lachancea meyersii CBS 8951]|uniref:LAME_0E13036g1_1 n=1 Tax=Lachancea meyersii CBS 8951 TaxID=1266667 RepID=A0A1G4JM81_9SACH|nr:LAME_0E13036g1_1 [Lachancea meyersii CBS 8951]
MSSLDVSEKPAGLAEESKIENGEQVVTVFDLATEIEQSLQKVMEDVRKNDLEFQEQFEAIQKRLRSLEK